MGLSAGEVGGYEHNLSLFRIGTGLPYVIDSSSLINPYYLVKWLNTEEIFGRGRIEPLCDDLMDVRLSRYAYQSNPWQDMRIGG